MRARYHGEPITSLEAASLPKARAAGSQKPTFGFMFGNLSDDPANRLPEGQTTIKALIALGSAMTEDPSRRESGIPAAYTYFGQFIDHDITKTDFDPSINPPGIELIGLPFFQPLSRADAISKSINLRSAKLDLDSLYGGLAADHATDPNGRMILGKVSSVPPGAPPSIITADRLHDLPRYPRIANPVTEQEKELDRQALIGDPRNDENLLVAQMHVAFLRAHNALMDRNLSAHDAQVALRRRYQWAVLHDFLPRVCQREVIDDVLQNGPTFWKIETGDDLFMPFEFSVAAYRFGHSMIRGGYSHNSTFTGEPFSRFFTFTALSGDLFEFDSLPNNWIIEWHRFFGTPTTPASINPARRIDANLTPELSNLRDFHGAPIASVMAKLAARNLLRGYLLGLPTGQAVAAHLGVPALSPNVLRAATPSGLNRLIEDAGLLERTPLWFYILAEAGDPSGADGQTLGPVGSRIVAETLWILVKHSPDSVIDNPPTEAELETGEFTLKGIIKLGLDDALPRIL